MITIDAYLISHTENVDCTKQVTRITWVGWKKWQVNKLLDWQCLSDIHSKCAIFRTKRPRTSLSYCTLTENLHMPSGHVIWQFLHARLQIYQVPGFRLPGYFEDCYFT